MSILKGPTFRRVGSVAKRDLPVDLPEDEKPLIFAESSEPVSSALSHLTSRPGLTSQQYWDAVIEEIESMVRCDTKPRVPQIDYSIVLPPRLKSQVKKIMPYDFSEDDNLIYIKDDLRVERVEDFAVEGEEDADDNEKKFIIELRSRKKAEYFNESQFSDIVRMDHEFERFDLRLEEPVSHRADLEDKQSWLSKFICGSRIDRIIWDSKIHKRIYETCQKSLDEQAEDLMDASAERFIEWLNNVGSAEVSGITIEKLKELFSIKGDRTLLASIKTDPKEVNAIAKTVADKWNKPQMAIELQYEAYINERLKRVPKTKILSAFGRTIPQKERPWVKSSTDVPIETIFPSELLTREKIFKGIRHLRSTHALIDFYRNRPRLSRPEYLVALGDFQAGVGDQTKREIPLYEYLGLKY